MKRSTLALLAALALGGALLAGCGGNNNDKGAGAAAPAETTATAETTGGGAAAGGEVKVSMKDIKFAPENVTVKVGQKIVWTNDDPVAHTVTAQEGAAFDSGTVDAGGTYEFTPNKAGTIKYVCTIHPGQKGSITVTK